MKGIKLSLVIPTFNEESNVEKLYSKIILSMKKYSTSYEIIFIDDGSTDKTLSKLQKIRKNDKRVKIVVFRRNFGQTAAMDAGIKSSRGEIICTLDADLQNDPEDIPKMIKKLESGYDCISGWRIKRQDSFSKRTLSLLARLVRRTLTKDVVHDSGCTLKVYRRECFEDLNLYGEMHRFIPLLLSMKGFKIGELRVRHHPRNSGKTKYGFFRVFRGFLDLLLVKFWMEFSVRPIHLFGSVGILSGLFGLMIGFYLVFQKFVYNVSVARPLLMLGVLLIIVGIQFFLFGILADLLIKIYYHNKINYSIKRVI